MIQPPLVLLLEDEPVLRKLMVEVLVEAGYPVLEGEHGRRGLELAKAYHGSFALVISDVKMPVLDGLEFARTFRQWFPAVPILFITGYAENCAAGVIPNCGVLGKPFGRDRLLAAVHRLLAECHDERPAASR